MAEFCLDCVNADMGPEYEPMDEADVVLGMDWCEGCGAYKPCVIRYRWGYSGPRKIVKSDSGAALIGLGLKGVFRRIAQKWR